MKTACMLRRCRTALALTAAVTSLFATSRAATFTLTTQFDTTPDSTLTAPFSGSGTLSYDAASPLGNGSYNWLDLQNLTLNLFGFFTASELATTASTVNVEIRDGFFFFSNDNPDGVGDGPGGGSADFTAFFGTPVILSTEARTPGESGVGLTTGAGSNAPRYIAASGGGPTTTGNYGVPVPEPSSFAIVALGGTALFGGRRRFRCS